MRGWERPRASARPLARLRHADLPGRLLLSVLPCQAAILSRDREPFERAPEVAALRVEVGHRQRRVGYLRGLRMGGTECVEGGHLPPPDAFVATSVRAVPRWPCRVPTQWHRAEGSG